MHNLRNNGLKLAVLLISMLSVSLALACGGDQNGEPDSTATPEPAEALILVTPSVTSSSIAPGEELQGSLALSRASTDDITVTVASETLFRDGAGPELVIPAGRLQADFSATVPPAAVGTVHSVEFSVAPEDCCRLSFMDLRVTVTGVMPVEITPSLTADTVNERDTTTLNVALSRAYDEPIVLRIGPEELLDEVQSLVIPAGESRAGIELRAGNVETRTVGNLVLDVDGLCCIVNGNVQLTVLDVPPIVITPSFVGGSTNITESEIATLNFSLSRVSSEPIQVTVAPEFIFGGVNPQFTIPADMLMHSFALPAIDLVTTTTQSLSFALAPEGCCEIIASESQLVVEPLPRLTLSLEFGTPPDMWQPGVPVRINFILSRTSREPVIVGVGPAELFDSDVQVVIPPGELMGGTEQILPDQIVSREVSLSFMVRIVEDE